MTRDKYDKMQTKPKLKIKLFKFAKVYKNTYKCRLFYHILYDVWIIQNLKHKNYTY